MSTAQPFRDFWKTLTDEDRVSVQADVTRFRIEMIVAEAIKRTAEHGGEHSGRIFTCSRNGEFICDVRAAIPADAFASVDTGDFVIEPMDMDGMIELFASERSQEDFLDFRPEAVLPAVA